MFSPEKEMVPLNVPIDPESPKNKGNVEIWLLELEGMQWESIRKQCELCLNDYLKQKRSAWILCWCAQAILAVIQIYWTADCEAAFDKGGHQELAKYKQVCSDNLLETVYMVRGKLSKLERKTLSALHARSTALELPGRALGDPEMVRLADAIVVATRTRARTESGAALARSPCVVP